MKYLKYLALLGVLMVPLAYSQAQVAVGIGIGPGYVGAPPVCQYGYYPDYPYACAPYGYYGPQWFTGGLFIGAGPWYRGWGHPFYGRGFYGRGYYGGRGFYGGRGWVAPDRGRTARGFSGRGFDGHAQGGGGFRGGESHGGGARGGRR